MPRKPNEEVPDHPTIAKEVVSWVRYGKHHNAAQVTCPGCSSVRLQTLASLRSRIQQGSYTGRCAACRKLKPRTSMNFGKVRTKNGYIVLRYKAVDPARSKLFLGLSAAGRLVFEHDWNMIQLLGRPLKDGEAVEHRNHQRDDNRIENLELVIVWPSGQRTTVLGELIRARAVVRAYGELEARLQAAKAGQPYMAPEQPEYVEPVEPV